MNFRRFVASGLHASFVLFFCVLLEARFEVSGQGASDQGGNEIATLIQQLGDKDFKIRNAATRKLIARKDGESALQEAKKSGDAEIARRAALILEERASHASKKALDRLVDLANMGKVDQAVELLVRRREWADEEGAWQVMSGLAAKLIKFAEEEFGEPVVPPPNDRLPIGDFRRYAEKYRPLILTSRLIVPDKVKTRLTDYVVRAEEIFVKSPSIGYNLLVSAGPIRGSDDLALAFSVVFANGPI